MNRTDGCLIRRPGRRRPLGTRHPLAASGTQLIEDTDSACRALVWPRHGPLLRARLAGAAPSFEPAPVALRETGRLPPGSPAFQGARSG